METLQGTWLAIENALAVHAVAPFLDWLHIAKWTDDSHLIARFLMISLLQVSVIGLIYRPVERWFPLEQQPSNAIAIDRAYTLLKL